MVIFVDAVHPTHAVRPVGCWAPKEAPVAVEQSSGRDRATGAAEAGNGMPGYIASTAGVVAIAANDKGVIYKGAFGTRNLAQGAAMTPDTIFRIASMTKAVTSVAAMQLVEQGRLQLAQPIGGVLPELSAPQVLEGFDDAGAPRLRPAKRPITLRDLLTHTAGFGYEFLNADLIRYVKVSGTPSGSTGKLASLRMPLVFDPGERWEYGINIAIGSAERSKRSAARSLFSPTHLARIR